MHELRLLGGVKEAILDVLETESAGRPGHELPAAEEKRGRRRRGVAGVRWRHLGEPQVVCLCWVGDRLGCWMVKEHE